MALAGKKYLTLLLSLILLFLANSVSASHIFGGELLYTHINNNSYKITLTLYGDCSGESFSSLINSFPGVNIFRNGVLVQTLEMPEDISLRQEVSPVCDKDTAKTACKSVEADALPGVTRFIYTDTVILPPSADWRLVFNGDLNNGNFAAGRSNNITNIFINDGQLVYLEANLNNLNGPNSSPQYSSIPTPFYCINRAQEYNQGALDADGDSLVFSLVPALANGTPVQYRNPFTATEPLAAQSGSFNFKSESGQLSFIPNLLQKSVVVTRVDEYKKGLLVGSSLREMTVIVLNNCFNTPPVGIVDTVNITGGGVLNNEINVCQNTPLLELYIHSSDADSNDVHVTVQGLPQGAYTSVNNNGAKPIIKFTWNTSNIPLGVYNMFVTYVDNACPIASTQTIAYTIRIVKPINITHKILKPTGCVFRQTIELNISEGLLPRLITVKNIHNQVLKTYIDTTGVIVDSFKTGKYKIQAESIALKCKSEYSFEVIDYGTYAIPVVFSDINTCLNAPVEPISVKPGQNATLRWYNMEGSLMDTTPVYTTETTGKYQWLVTQVFDTCETIPDTFTVAVNELPSINVLNTNERLCNGDTVQLKAEGGIKYNWEPGNWIKQNDTFALAWVRKPTNYVVTGYNEYNCAGKDSILMDNLDQCCQFFYPDAFSPNGDGLNDKWLPVTPANTDFYHLAIYNRWGQRIFESTDPNLKWDGSFKGRPCDIGTYNFFIQAKCVMGRQEAAQGTILLVR